MAPLTSLPVGMALLLWFLASTSVLASRLETAVDGSHSRPTSTSPGVVRSSTIMDRWRRLARTAEQVEEMMDNYYGQVDETELEDVGSEGASPINLLTDETVVQEELPGGTGEQVDESELEYVRSWWFPINLLTDVTVVQALPGLTGPMKVRWSSSNSSNGEFVRKGGPRFSRGQVENEFWANEIYAVLSLPAPHCELYPYPGDKSSSHLLCEWVDNLKSCTHLYSCSQLDNLKTGFVIDALLGNYDLVGNTGNAAVQAESNDLYRIDSGSALMHCAQPSSGFKSTVYKHSHPLQFRQKTFSKLPWQLWDFRSEGGYHGVAVQVYQNLSVAEIAQQIEDVHQKKDEILAVIRKDPGVDPELAEDAENYLSTRIECLWRVKESADNDVLGKFRVDDAVRKAVESQCADLLSNTRDAKKRSRF